MNKDETKLARKIGKALNNILEIYHSDLIIYGNAFFEINDRKIELVHPKKVKLNLKDKKYITITKLQ